MVLNKFRDLIRDKSFISGIILSGILVIILKFVITETRYAKALFFMMFFASVYLLRFKKYNSFAFGVLSFTSLTIVLYALHNIRKDIGTIQEWDFICFYLYGKLGVSGSDFYNPENLTQIYSSLKPAFEVSSGFSAEVLDVGFPYPPVTMILFAPLSWFNMETANILWKLSVLTFLIIDTVLLVRLFNENFSAGTGILVVMGITLLFPGIQATMFFSQTTFLLLFFLLLTYKNSDNWKSGIFLALAITVKPLAVIWCLYLFINKNWKSLIALICSGILIASITGILFGFDSFLSYINSPPTNRMPAYVYTDSINQSLFATLSRLNTNLGLDFSGSGISYLVLSVSLILTLLTAIASWRLANSNEKLSFLIFIPLSLLIYPGSLTSYSIFLIPVFFEILYRDNNLPIQNFFKILLVVFFMYFIFSNNAGFIIILIILISLIVYSLFAPKSRSNKRLDHEIKVISSLKR